MTSHPVHTDPAVTEPHVRMIVFTWQLGQITDDRGRVCTGFAELVVSHLPATNAFTAALRHGVRLPQGGTHYNYRLDQPGWRMSQPITRYSRPRLAAYAARALAALRTADPAEIAYAFEEHQS